MKEPARHFFSDTTLLPKKGTVRLLTLGCSKNIVSSEVLCSQLRRGGYAVLHEDTQTQPTADHYTNATIINTCGFIALAKKESIESILEQVVAKKEGKTGKLYVVGCLSERYREELRREIPEVDAYFGTHDLMEVLRVLQVEKLSAHPLEDRQHSTPSFYAYLKISEGCNRACSFCAIPNIQGKHRSRSVESLVKEAKNLAEKGVKELILVAQDLSFYGYDLYGKQRLKDLLCALSAVEGIAWIRLHYAYPAGFPKDILKVMGERENICHYLDMPLQHGSNEVLKAMRRGITRNKMERLIGEIREAIPDIALRTTFLVGYPNETEEHYQSLLDFVEAQAFDRLGVFTYSHEEHTHAYRLKDSVPEKVKNKRADRLMSLQRDISRKKNMEKVGSLQKVLVERETATHYVGRTEYDSPDVDNQVFIEKSEKNTAPLTTGSFVLARVERATPFDLFAAYVPS